MPHITIFTARATIEEMNGILKVACAIVQRVARRWNIARIGLRL